MDIGVCTISSKSRSVESVVDLCGELAVDGVEIWGKDHIGDGSGERCREIATAATECGLDIPVYGSYLRPGTGEFRDSLRRELDVADHLGADAIRVWAGDQEYQECSETHWKAVIDDMGTLAESAQSRGLSITVERHGGTVTNRTEGARRLIEAVDSPTVGLNWQPYFEQDAEAVAADVGELADLVNNVHLQAVSRPGETDRCALADAYFDVAGVVETLDDRGFDGFLEIEFVTQSSPYRAALASDVAFVRSLL